MTQYLDLFIQESEEQLAVLEQETLVLEREPSAERLQTIFRAAHTLKGSSRAMGFSRFAGLTHAMEDVLDQLRNGSLEVSREIADALLECVDALRQLSDNVRDGKGDAGDVDLVLKRLRAALQAPTCEAPTETGTASTDGRLISADHVAELAQKAHGKSVVHLHVRLNAECVMKFARAYMVLGVVQGLGALLAVEPEQSKLEEEEFGQDFELVFAADSVPGDLQAQLASISEVESVAITLAEKPALKLESGGAQAGSRDSAAADSDAVKAPAQVGRKGETGQTVRVDVARLDNLMNLVGELVIDRTRIAQLASDLGAKFSDTNVDDLSETVGHIARITSDLQDQIMKARMLPIETVFNRFPRVVRDLANKLGKQVKLDLVGGDTELDRSVIEVIGDPLLHILRNSVDHGVEMPEDRLASGKPEQGQITVLAKHQENHIVVEIVDDGKGIDAERVRAKAVQNGMITAEMAARMTEKESLQLIFASGLSTATEVSEVSGRGVGMDIVRSNVQRLGGIIDIESEPGKGTRTSLRLPLTLAIIRGLLVRCRGNVYVLPLGSVVETMLLDEAQVQTINRREVIVIRGLTTPLLRMNDLFDTGRFAEDSNGQSYVVIVGLAEKRLGLVVDELIGEQEVVIKSISRFCGDVSGVSGATILGDGNVALIVDVNGVIPS